MDAKVIKNRVLSRSALEDCEPGSKVTDEQQRMTKRSVSETRRGQCIFKSDGMNYRGKRNGLKAATQNKDTYPARSTRSMKEKATGKRNH